MKTTNKLGDSRLLSDDEYNAIHGKSLYYYPTPRNAKQVVDFCGSVDIDEETLTRFALWYNTHSPRIRPPVEPGGAPGWVIIPMPCMDVVLRCHAARHQAGDLEELGQPDDSTSVLDHSPVFLPGSESVWTIRQVTEEYPLSDRDRDYFFRSPPEGEHGTTLSVNALNRETKDAFTRLGAELSEIRALTEDAAQQAAAAHEMARHGVDQAVTIAEIEAKAMKEAGRRRGLFG